MFQVSWLPEALTDLQRQFDFLNAEEVRIQLLVVLSVRS